jgi:DnaJ-domain-containing protein 1
MQTNTRAVQKTAILVEISLADGSVILGKIFVSHQGRVSDVLNDDRAFLPVESSDGTTCAIAKTAIKQVSLPVAETAAAYRGGNPYLVLGVREDVSPEDLKKVYHQLCLANHPDRIKGFGLGVEYQDLATRNMARINSAYAQITKRLGN